MKTSSGQGELRDGTLTIRMREKGPGCVLSLEGELDMANAGTLELALERAEARGSDPVRIDLSELDFIDSAGIALLVAVHHRLTESERLSLVPSRAPGVRRVMALTGLDSELPFVVAR